MSSTHAAPVSGARYGAWLVRIHWLTLLLIAAAYASIELHDEFRRGGAVRGALEDSHFVLGLAVLALTVVRIALRLAGKTPPITPPLSHAQAAVAHAMHLALYVFMIAMPLLGWLALGAEGETPTWFGVRWPPLVGVDDDLADELEDWHEDLGTAGYWLIGLHAAAALFHHYVVRDDTLRRMWPRRRGARAQ